MYKISTHITTDQLYISLGIGTGALIIGILVGIDNMPLWKYIIGIYMMPIIIFLISNIETE